MIPVTINIRELKHQESQTTWVFSRTDFSCDVRCCYGYTITSAMQDCSEDVFNRSKITVKDPSAKYFVIFAFFFTFEFSVNVSM